MTVAVPALEHIIETMMGYKRLLKRRKLDEKNNTSLTEQNNTLFFSVRCLTFFKFIFHSLLSETSITIVFAILEPYLLSLSVLKIK